MRRFTAKRNNQSKSIYTLYFIKASKYLFRSWLERKVRIDFMFFEIHLLGVLCSCQSLGTKHNLGLNYLGNICKFGKFYLSNVSQPAFWPLSYWRSSDTRAKLAWRQIQCWALGAIGKRYHHNQSTCWNIIKDIIMPLKNKSPPTRNTHHACDHRQAGTQQRHPWSTLCEVELFLSMMYLYFY